MSLPVTADEHGTYAAQSSWQGSYAGIQLGYAQTSISPDILATEAGTTSLINAISSGSISPSSYEAKGISGGGQFGYNFRPSSNWLFSIETDFQWGDIDANASSAFTYISGVVPFRTDVTSSLDWYGTLRGRLGYLIRPQLLAYATGGLAYGQVKETAVITNLSGTGVVTSSFTCSANAVCASTSKEDVEVGWSVGGGMEYMLKDRTLFDKPVSIKIDYLYTDLGDRNISIPTITSPSVSFNNDLGRTDIHNIRAGINVRF